MQFTFVSSFIKMIISEGNQFVNMQYKYKKSLLSKRFRLNTFLRNY